MKTKTTPSGPLHEIAFGLSGRQLAILIFSWLAMFAGINTIPIEEHESFVLQTAREMNATGEWVLPHFNQDPRLEKPPLNYWLTLGVSRLSGGGFEPWTGRACSMLAGLALVLFTACTGARLYGGRVGFLAGALLLGTHGFADYSHHARPDFLYAVLCVLQLFAWTGAWRAADGSVRQGGASALGWALAGLATLAKGPQVPALFLLGFLIFLLSGEDRRRTLKVLRPFSGLIILLAIALPWWLMLKQRVREAGIELHKTQLSGSLLMSLAGWKGILDFYYVGNILRMLLPVSLVLPLLVFWNRRNCAMPTGFARMLVYVSAVMLVVFTVVGHYRPHYMLPLLPLCILLLAAWVDRAAGRPLNRVAWLGLSGAAVVALAACAGLLIWNQQYVDLALLVGAGVALSFLALKEIRSSYWREHPLFVQLLVAAMLTVLLSAGFNSLPSRNAARWRDRNFAISIADAVSARDHLATWKAFPETLPYYVQNRVLRFQDLNELKSCFEQKRENENVYVVVPQRDLETVDGLFEAARISTREYPRKPSRALVFLKILKVRS